MTTSNSSFYKRQSEKRAIYTNGFLYEGKNRLSDKFYSKQTGLTCMPRSKSKGVIFPMTLKNVHINFCFWGAQLCYVINGSMLYASEAITRDRMPDLFVRHIRFHKYWGEVKVVEINGELLKIETFEGIKTVLRKVFVKGAVNSIKEWVGKKELERLRFNERIDNTDNYFNNYATL